MDSEPLHPSLTRPLQFVTGKGGVGKSLISAAIALRLAASGKRTLLCQINTADAHGPLLEIDAVTPVVREALPNLHVVDTTPLDALREYALLTLRWRTVYQAVFENRMVRHLLRFLPSLAELNMLGKAWYHTGAGGPHDAVFEHVVVDAPATGHGLTFLSVARVVADSAPAGPLKDQTEAMARFIEDVERCAVHVVSIPEQLAVDETIEMVTALRHRRAAPLGLMVLNRYGPHDFHLGDAERLAIAAGRGHDAVAALLDHARLRALEEARQRRVEERLRQLLRLPGVAIPELEPPLGRAQLAQIGALLPRDSATAAPVGPREETAS